MVLLKKWLLTSYGMVSVEKIVRVGATKGWSQGVGGEIPFAPRNEKLERERAGWAVHTRFIAVIQDKTIA